MAESICFVGGARYTQPLDCTAAKKFRALRALGEIFVVGFSTEVKPLCFTEQAHFYLLPQLPAPLLRYAELIIFGPLLTLWLLIRHRIDVVIAQSPYEGLVAAVAIRLASWFGYQVRFAVEVHGDFENSLFAYRSIKCPGVYRYLMNRIAAYVFRRADILRSISASTTAQLKRRAPAKTIVEFPAWTDMETFLAAGREKKSLYANRVIYAGALTPVKGVHHLIAAFSEVVARIADAQLWIVGADLDRDYAERLRKQVHAQRLDDRVRFCGLLPQPELARRMAEASVLVLPSESEGFGRVLLEAMATGTPVIGSDVGGIPELIEEGVNGFLVAPGDERMLAEKIALMLANDEKTRAMGEAGHRFAGRLFSTARYLRGYREIITKQGAVPEQRKYASTTL